MLTTVALIALPGLAGAAPVQWGVNGHYYELVETRMLAQPPTWATNKAAAAARTVNDGALGTLTGHLATLTSQAENDFVKGLLLGFNTLQVPPSALQWHIGGFQTTNSASENAAQRIAGWTWITGEAWSFTNWHAAFQPDNNLAGGQYPQGEDALVIYSAPSGDARLGKWNDSPSYTAYVPSAWEQVGGYVVEYEPTPVPEPATMMTLGIGLFTLGARLRRR